MRTRLVRTSRPSLSNNSPLRRHDILSEALCGIRENLAGVIRRVHLGIGGCDSPLLVNEIANSHRIACLGIVAGAISQANFAVSVAQQFEWEMVLAGKSGIGGDIVEANAENDDAIAFESTVLVAEPATLPGSASGIGLGIEPQKNLTAAKR